MCEDNDGGSSSTSSISHHSDLENVTIETVAKNDGSGDTSVVNLLRREFRFQGLIMLYLLIIRLEQKHMRFVSVTEFLISMYFWGVIKVAA